MSVQVVILSQKTCGELDKAIWKPISAQENQARISLLHMRATKFSAFPLAQLMETLYRAVQ